MSDTPRASGLRILIVEDHDDFRHRLSALLSSYPEFSVRAVPDAQSALRAFEVGAHEVVIMDINLQPATGQGSSSFESMNGIACTRAIKQKHPEVQVLICTVHEDEERIFEALKAGASGYILKRAPLPELIEAIRQVHRGESPMTGTIARKVVSSFQAKPLQCGEKLTTQEQKVLDLLAEGLKAREIAEKLFISITTVRSHVRGIYEKLQVQNRVEMLKKTGRVR
jgi:DNA-binding NarL/FixJ family response regulator